MIPVNVIDPLDRNPTEQVGVDCAAARFQASHNFEAPLHAEQFLRLSKTPERTNMAEQIIGNQ
jgi:hypothetical protein